MATQQAQVTNLSAPVAPAQDKGFVSATTAPKSFVLIPGADFPNHGPVRQNEFSQGNSAGTDGLTLLQQVLAGGSLFPAIPLPSSLVEYDGSLALPSNVDMGTACTFSGILNGDLQIIFSNGHTMKGVAEYQNLTINCDAAGADFVQDEQLFTLTSCNIVASAGVFFRGPGGPTDLTFQGQGQIGDGTNAVFHVGASESFTLRLKDRVTIDGATWQIDAGGAVSIEVYSPSVQIDESLFNVTGISFVYRYSPPAIATYRPGAGAIVQSGIFGDFAAMVTYIGGLASQGLTVWDIEIDASNVGGTATVAGADYPMPTEVHFRGVNGTLPTLEFDDPARLTPAPLVCSAENVILTTTNTSLPVLTMLTGGLFVLIDAHLAHAGPAALLFMSGTSEFQMYGTARLATSGVFHVSAASTSTVSAFDQSDIEVGSLVIEATGAATVNLSPDVFWPHNLLTTAGITVVFEYTPPSSLVYQPNGTDSRSTFTDFAQVALYMAAVGASVPKWTIYGDGSANSGDVQIPNGTYAMPPSVSFQSVIAPAIPATEYPTLSFGGGLGDCIFDPPPFEVTMANFGLITNNNTTSPLATYNDQNFGFYGTNCAFNGAGSQPFFSLTNGAMGIANFTLTNFFGLGEATAAAFAVDATSALGLELFDQGQAFVGGITVVPGGSLFLENYSAAWIIDPAIVALATSNDFFSTADNVKYTAASSANWSGTPPTSVAAALDRIAAKITPIP